MMSSTPSSSMSGTPYNTGTSYSTANPDTRMYRFSDDILTKYKESKTHIPAEAIPLVDYFQQIGLPRPGPRTSTEIAIVIRSLEKLAFILYPVVSEDSHTYGTSPIYFYPDGLRRLADRMGESSISGIPNSGRDLRGTTDWSGTGNNIYYRNLRILIPGNTITKTAIKALLDKEKNAVTQSVQRIQELHEKVAFLDIVGKEEYSVKEHEAFKVLRTIDYSAPITEQIAKILALIK